MMRSEGGAGLRLTAGGASLLAGAVLADSAIEHYRGSFHNPAMIAPLPARTCTESEASRTAVKVMLKGTSIPKRCSG